MGSYTQLGQQRLPCADVFAVACGLPCWRAARRRAPLRRPAWRRWCGCTSWRRCGTASCTARCSCPAAARYPRATLPTLPAPRRPASDAAVAGAVQSAFMRGAGTSGVHRSRAWRCPRSTGSRGCGLAVDCPAIALPFFCRLTLPAEQATLYCVQASSPRNYTMSQHHASHRPHLRSPIVQSFRSQAPLASVCHSDPDFHWPDPAPARSPFFQPSTHCACHVTSIHFPDGGAAAAARRHANRFTVWSPIHSATSFSIQNNASAVPYVCFLPCPFASLACPPQRHHALCCVCECRHRGPEHVTVL